MRAFEREEGRCGKRTYVNCLEQRAGDRKGTRKDESLQELRRGRFFGDKRFGAKVPAAVAKQVRPTPRKGSLGGEAGDGNRVSMKAGTRKP